MLTSQTYELGWLRLTKQYFVPHWPKSGVKKCSARFVRRICPHTFKTVAPPLASSKSAWPTKVDVKHNSIYLQNIDIWSAIFTSTHWILARFAFRVENHAFRDITTADEFIIRYRCDPCWPCDMPVWYFSEKKWRYALKPAKECRYGMPSRLPLPGRISASSTNVSTWIFRKLQ